MYEFWYDYVKPKYGKKAKWCYMDTDTDFIVYIKTDDIYKDIADDIGTRFDTLTNYELEYSSIERLLLKGKKLKSNWIKERWIRRKSHNKNVGLRAKTNMYM